MPDESAVKMADGLLEAMQAEHEGYHFYSMAAMTTIDSKGKEVFAQLAADELEHFEFLRKQHKSVLDNGRPDAGISLGPRSGLSGSSPIFSPQIKDRIADAHYEITALSVGAQLELNSIRHYERAAREADDPVAGAFFEELAAWEQDHYDVLVAQQEILKEDYWAKSSFAPF
ncbi:MAG: ferritin family protein [Polyangia bacterium]